jgi:hypothetical protein
MKDIELGAMTWAQDNPFRVVHVIISPTQERFFLKGDIFKSPESWKGRDICTTNIMFFKDDIRVNKKEGMDKLRKVVREGRLQDLKDVYKMATETDGSKVNWKPIIYKNK